MKIKIQYTILAILIALTVGCGSKKTVSQSEKKEKTDIELTDNSTINTKIEQEQQLIDTKIKERIVTLYGVRFDTIRVDGKETITATPYPLQTEENRDIAIQELRDYLSRKDSIQNAVELKYENDLKEKDNRISEFKETETLYHIALIVLGVGLLLLLIFFLRK